MDYLTSLKKRLADNETAIASLKDKLASLEMEQHKLSIALEVVASLEPEPSPRTPAGFDARQERQLDLVDQHEQHAVAAPIAAKPSGKDLIVKTLAEAGFPLTRMDVVSRLAAAGHHLNSTTVGSTLSRLVDAGTIEKASHSQYRVKQPASPGSEQGH